MLSNKEVVKHAASSNMREKTDSTSDTERIARTIVRCYSKGTLSQAAAELGAPLVSGTDIFRSMILAGKATDFDNAVMLVATHLDASPALLTESEEGMVDGKIERRKTHRAQ